MLQIYRQERMKDAQKAVMMDLAATFKKFQMIPFTTGDEISPDHLQNKRRKKALATRLTKDCSDLLADFKAVSKQATEAIKRSYREYESFMYDVYCSVRSVVLFIFHSALVLLSPFQSLRRRWPGWRGRIVGLQAETPSTDVCGAWWRWSQI